MSYLGKEGRSENRRRGLLIGAAILAIVAGGIAYSGILNKPAAETHQK